MFFLFTINNIYFIEKYSKNFKPVYIKIEKILKKIPYHENLLKLAEMLTKKIRFWVLKKTRF